jgi:hypothetical protein
MSELRIEYWPTNRLVPYADNPRRNDAVVPRMEIDPRYAQVALVRWQDFTGKQAMRGADGLLFDELSA